MKPEDVIVKITIFKISQNLLGLKMATYFTAQSNFSKLLRTSLLVYRVYIFPVFTHYQRMEDLGKEFV